VSRLNHTLTEQYAAWRERPLLTHYPIIYLDGIHFTVRHGTKTDATMILTALGVDLEGSREVLALRACTEEDKDGWSCLLQDLRTRGVTSIDLLPTDMIAYWALFQRSFPPRRGNAAWFTNSAT
jgi:putative transposase